MNQTYQGSNPDGSADVPVKRKRGRPRKYPKLDLEEKARIPKDQNLNRRENDRVPPGFGGVNGNQPRQVDSIDNANDGMAGQVVSGVIEAAFDAGYLLSVRVGNSDTTLRGVVFKPGHYVPISAENDVAPEMQMIRRNEVPLPAENYTHVHGYNPRSREREQKFNSRRNGTHSLNEVPIVNRVVPQSANLVASKGKQVPSVAAQTARPVIPKGNVVPVVLKPVNGIALANQPSSYAIQAPHLVASKSNKVVGGAQSSDGSIVNNQVPVVVNQTPPPQPQASHQFTPKDSQSDNVPCTQPPEEVSKKIQGLSESAKTEIDGSTLAGKTSVKGSGHKQVDEVNDMDQPLLIEPLQAVQPDPCTQPDPAAKPFENNITGKMTQLLQVLQESAMENQVPWAEKPATASVLKLEEPRN
ncbi:protein METABOLIC NETWORK MODULATOR 1 isoform X2 [Alnus glutinosa]|uniref:protein METABOLIC NETWORK MODULATOR 1 isoform X2 n=1 Tax=Alnus glutinosa TaxID=3517 RepID=UPI002D795BBD|nr:protein METABOLIC NETWORK MODULATOR 1 isoform X2 [Alnus glutinosa]